MTLAPTPTGEPKQAEAGTETVPASIRPTQQRGFVVRLLLSRWLWTVAILAGLTAGGIAVARPQLRAWYHLRAAREELQRCHNPQAIRHLHVCLQVWPHDPEVMLLAAQAARRGRSYAEAERLLEMYQQARGLDEAVSREQLLLTAERRIEQVSDLCWHHVEQGRPDAPLILEALTRGYLRQYRLNEARLCLDRWLALQPDHPQPLCLEGLYLLDYGHARTAAEVSYRRAVELDPEHEEARLGLAVTLLDGRKFEEAEQHLTILRQCQPDNLSIQVGLADCRDGMGDIAEAVRQVDAVLAQNPHFTPALALRGRLALKSGQSEDAERYLREAVAHNPIDHRSRYSLYLSLQQNGKEDEARREQQQLKQAEEDLARFNEIVTKDIVQRPRDPALHCTLGELLLRSGQREEGLRWLQSALHLDPQYAPALQALEAYRQQEKARQEVVAPGKDK